MGRLVVLSFKRYGEADLAQFSTNVILRMERDAQFESLMPDVNVLKVCDAAFDEAVSNALDGGPKAVKIKNAKMAELNAQLETVALKVDALADGDEDVILAAGFEVAKTPTGVVEITSPTDLKVVNDVRSGVVKLSWKKVKGAVSYGIERMSSEDSIWRNGDYSTAKSIVITNLKPGTYVTFRNRTISTKSRVSGWSQEVSIWVS
jgi:hypothetical protein